LTLSTVLKLIQPRAKFISDPLVQQLQAAELAAFGANLREYGKEIKGSKLLDKDRFKWATACSRESRHRHALHTDSSYGRAQTHLEIKANSSREY
jgi:hypothetical protein